MKIDRRTFLFLAAGVAGYSCSRFSSSLQRAVRFLWAQQGADGGFHSNTYGLLRSGQSLTPFVMNALLRVPQTVEPMPQGALRRALDFIRSNTRSDGALGIMDDTAADYPNYATALAVSVLTRVQPSDGAHAVARMVRYLRIQQFSEENGWSQNDPAYGGWGMGGTVRHPPDAGHVDISMTRFVMEALRDAGVSSHDPAMIRAHNYLERCQGSDGGFHFSPVNPEINKAGQTNGEFVSYGTATVDGLLAMRAAGIAEGNAKIVDAVRWLVGHHRSDRAPVLGENSDQWEEGLRFYYAHAISRALPQLPVLLPPQDADGGFRNNNNLVKEDDPLIATPFAIHVMVAGLAQKLD